MLDNLHVVITGAAGTLGQAVAAKAQDYGAHGTIDILLNIAGGFAMGDTATNPDSRQWEQMFRLNVDTMRNATMGAVPLMQARGRGAIVNVGALGALSGQGAMSAYCCAKSPAQLAEVICFLASERAVAIHGALLPVRGLS